MVHPLNLKKTVDESRAKYVKLEYFAMKYVICLLICFVRAERETIKNGPITDYFEAELQKFKFLTDPV